MIRKYKTIYQGTPLSEKKWKPKSLKRLRYKLVGISVLVFVCLLFVL